MADLAAIRRLLSDAGRERAELAGQRAEIGSELTAERGRLAALQAAGDDGGARALAARIRDLMERRKQSAQAIAALDERLRGGIDELFGDDELELEGDVPLVLLPVRVEVRSTADQSALRVRIFHDTAHAETLDEGLSDAERQAGIEYWQAVWKSRDSQAPWPALVAAAGARRAAWIAEALRPTNLDAEDGQPPVFPDTSPRGGQRAVARTLPDRFYVRVEQDGAPPRTEHGNAIPDELPIGLADRDELSVLKLPDEDLPPIDESLRWLVDYKEAERIGMAVTVRLPLPGRDVRRLVVYGVRAALDPSAGAARLERLLRSHRFTDGAELVAQGTPTNNTESVRTEWSRRSPPGAPDLAAERDLDGGMNAFVMASALGVAPDLLTRLPGGAGHEDGRAAAFNAALWATTWGDAIEHLSPAGRTNGDKRLDNASLDAVRDHWVAHVRGRGPLPALRLGRQPYGVLPVVATDESWRPLRDDFVENRLIPFIHQQLRWMWDRAQADVATVMNRPLDTALPEILGTDAVLQGLRVRTALSPEPLVKGAMALTLPDLGDDRHQQQVTRALLLLAGVDAGELDDHHLLGTKTRSLALPLVHASDPQFIAELLESGSSRELPRSVLQVLLAHAAAVERHARATLAPPAMLGTLHEAILSTHVDVGDGDRERLATALGIVLEDERFDDPRVARAAKQVAGLVGRLDSRVLADRHPFPALAPETAVHQVAGRALDVELLRGDRGMQLVGEVFQRARWSARFRDALQTISGIESMDERRLLLCETLDCCSHRLDAWITSAATRRLHDLRVDGAEGARIGAYGWLENIKLSTPAAAGQVDGKDVLHDTADGGYIHAPGLTHAATAGVLRSGRLTHRRGDPNDEPLEINLSSTRVRDALSLLDGMRHGQSLGALLGYRLERRLHESLVDGRRLDRFIYVLRTLAPLRAGKLTEPGQPAQESLAASDVVDGLRLLEMLETERKTIEQKLAAGPDDSIYIDAWDPPGPGEAEAVLDAVAELERTHDAVADLLLAESVHQLVSGNPTRAAAALDALGAGEAAPPEPEVVRTPRSGVPIQHRVAIVVPDPLPAPTPGWATDTPRARAEPRLDAWAQGVLGDPHAIDIAIGHPQTLADARLSALDVVYDADGSSVETSTLVARLRQRFPALGADLAPLALVWELAGMARALLLGGRPLDVADVGRPVEEGAVGRVPAADELLARATEAKDGLATAAAGGDPVADLAPFGVRLPPAQARLPLSDEERAAANEALVAEANARVETATLLLKRAAELSEPQPKTVAELASQALAAIFGDGFISVPSLLAPPAGKADPWSGAVGPHGVRAKAGADIRPWLARAGTLRAATSAYGETLLVREAYDRRPLLRVVQTPAGAYGSWVGLPFPDAKPPTVPLTSMVAEIVGASAGEPEPELGGAVAGVVLDEWTEVVPRRLLRGDPMDPASRLLDVATTAVAINANAPGARPPQAILVALSPDGGDWNAERLVGLLDETLALARMRGVTLQQIPFAGRYLPALYFRDWSLQGEPVIDWDALAVKLKPEHGLQFLRVDQ